MLRKTTRSSVDCAVVDVWKRAVGELSTRNFAQRLAASEVLSFISLFIDCCNSMCCYMSIGSSEDVKLNLSHFFLRLDIRKYNLIIFL